MFNFFRRIVTRLSAPDRHDEQPERLQGLLVEKLETDLAYLDTLTRALTGSHR